MKRALFGVALAALSLPLTAALPPVHADDSSVTYNNTEFGSSPDRGSSATRSEDSNYPYQGQSDFTVSGLVRRVDSGHDRLIIIGDDNRRYTVDDYNADVLLRSADRSGQTADLDQGMRVHITGTLLGRSFIEADRISVVSSRIAEDAPRPAALVLPAPEPVAPVATVTIQPVPVPAGHDISFDARITKVDADSGRVTLLGPDDQRLTADTHGSDIILPSIDHAGAASDLVRGMRVRLIGTQGADGVVQADRIRVLPDSAPSDGSPAPAPAAVAPAAITIPADVNLDQYTGILIDARDLHAIQRSMAPTIVGPGSALLLYPDRTHVPTPDEVQEESIVRYYRSVDAAMDGIAGSHPLILRAVRVVGSDDGLQLTAEDAALFQALDTRLHFTRTWKVGFLIPSDR